MRHTLFSLALATSFATTGCASMIFQNPQPVVLTSNAKGAFVVGHGRLPRALPLDRKRDQAILVEAPGYESKTVWVHSHPSWWRICLSVLLNAAHGFPTLGMSFVAGCFVDVDRGAWQVLEEEAVDVELEPSTALPPALGFETKPEPGRAPFCPHCGASFERDSDRCSSCSRSRPPLIGRDGRD